jgi:hypothetical protein
MRRRLFGFAAAAGLLSVVAVIVLVLAVFASAGGAGNKMTVKADTLTGYQETPGNYSLGTGTFTATVDQDASPPTISYTLSYSGLSSPAHAAHIHFGNRYDPGAVVAFLCGGGGKPVCPAGGGTVTGTITPADVLAVPNQGITAGDFAALVAIIRAGMSYVNVHTTNFPGGEIRGQVNNDNQRQPE